MKLKRKIFQNKKILFILIINILIIMNLLGCISMKDGVYTGPYDIKYLGNNKWEVQLTGFIIGNTNSSGWDVYFAFDTEYHEDFHDYEQLIEASFTLREGYFNYKFAGLSEGIYNYRAVGHNLKNNDWLCGNNTEFTLSL